MRVYSVVAPYCMCYVLCYASIPLQRNYSFEIVSGRLQAGEWVAAPGAWVAALLGTYLGVPVHKNGLT